MTALTETRDHARAMAEWKPPTAPITYWCSRGTQHERCDGRVENAVFADISEPCVCTCHPGMAGPTDAERSLWTQIADEIDAHLTPSQGPDLFAGGDPPT